ncbi:MAG: hydrogenase iron-sulfur subunit [Deltaproteobacteria bacterium]|nr:hydrogenase iron-sulfur subunit [Deltaproteobacteria bacterium]
MEKTALIVGSGTCAKDLAETLAASGISVLVTGVDGCALAWGSGQPPTEASPRLEIMDGAKIRSVSGSPGRFTVEFADQDRRIRRHVQDILIAEDPVQQVNGPLYGLTEGAGVISFSAFKSMLNPESGNSEAFESLSRVAFLTGALNESLPLIARDVMQAALDLQQSKGVQAYILTGNLKVAGHGLETLSRNAKEAGVIFIKNTERPPEIVQAGDGSITITYTDEVLRRPTVLNPDLTVVDETPLPSPSLKTLGDLLELETGPDGFLQADNIHRVLTLTNRKGIRVVGPARGVLSPVLITSEITHTALSLSWTKDAEEDEKNKARIETGKCVRCLTCVRICPYRAVVLAPRPVIAAAACEGCGICVAECPCEAIAFDTFPSTATPAAVEPESEAGGNRSGASAFIPHVTVFCCSRSAVPARNMARAMSDGFPKGLSFIDVPCAGAVSRLHLLNALSNGADGVLVVGCHPDNCHSGNGTLLARERSDGIKTLLPRLGVAYERLAFKNLAANMGAEFSQILEAFMAHLESLGPNPMKQKDRW